VRTGVFGGTFDPPHKGHARLARMAERACALDQILFIPCARQPLKAGHPEASAAHRCAMLALSLDGKANWLLDTREVERRGISYTVSTLESLRLERPDDTFFLLLGEDSFDNFARWRQPRRIIEIATLVVAKRTQNNKKWPATLAWSDSTIFLRPRPLDVSSSGVRARIAAGRPWESMVLPAVARYINRQGLYKQRRSG